MFRIFVIFLASMMMHYNVIVLADDFKGISQSKTYSSSGYQAKGGSSSGSNAYYPASPANAYKASPGEVVQAAVQTKHQIEFRDVPSSGNVVPTTIEVGANSVPLNILFKSASSSLNIQQMHDGAQGSVQESESEDEPHRLIHSVKKPIIQEVHEVISPFRKITQEIQPVQEEILTIVARGQDQPKSDYGQSLKPITQQKMNSDTKGGY